MFWESQNVFSHIFTKFLVHQNKFGILLKHLDLLKLTVVLYHATVVLKKETTTLK